MTSKETKLTGVAASIAAALPTRYRSKVGVFAAVLGVVVSAVSVTTFDAPAVAIAIQALTALGFVEKPAE